MSQSLAAQVERLIAEGAAEAVAAAEAAGYRRGFVEGRAEADGAWRARLMALAGVALTGVARALAEEVSQGAGAEALPSATREDGDVAGIGTAHPLAGAEGDSIPPPAPAEQPGAEESAPEEERDRLGRVPERPVETGASGPPPAVDAGLSSQVPPSPPAAVPAAAQEGGEAPRGIVAWRTAERRARLVKLYDDPAWSQGAIWRALQAMPGPSMAHLQAANISIWIKKLREEGVLGERPAGAPVRMGGVKPAAARVDEDEGEDVPVDTLPPGEVRETPQLRRARELLGMGMHPNDIKPAVKLSATEWAAILEEHRGKAA